MESVRNYQCLYDKFCGDYKSKVLVENVWAAVDKETGFEEDKEFSYLKKMTTKLTFWL